MLLALEGLCLFLIVQGNSWQRVRYFNTSAYAVARTHQTINQVNGYFNLKSVNEDLAAENARLLTELQAFKALNEAKILDSLSRDTTIIPADSLSSPYRYVVGKVINNSVSRINNYLTINRGTLHGVRPGMGVISPTGVVGRILHCSDNFSTVKSLLHSQMQISAEINRTKAFGSVKWKGKNPVQASLLYIARHLNPKVGDTVVTSSLSTIFPQGIAVGKITKVDIRDDDTFYTIDLDLSGNFGTLNYVYIVDNILKLEQDSLEARQPE